MRIEHRQVSEIFPYDNNPRINDRAVDAVAKSIEQFGFRQPIVVDEDGVIIVGHTRWKAAKKLGLEEVPVHVATGLSAEQIRAYRIADNKTNELADWDYRLLPEELQALNELDFDLSSLGFTERELSQLLDPGIKDGLCDPDEIPEPPDDPISRLGDLWVLGEHRLLCGDSAKNEDVDRLLDGATIHLANCDPPYNVRVEPRSQNAIAAGNSSFRSAEKKAHVNRSSKMRAKDRPLKNDFVTDEAFQELLLAWFGNIARVLEPGRCFYIWGGFSNIENYPAALRASGLYFSQTLIWHKRHPVITRKDFMGDHEWCQPADTMVMTPSGSARIASLRSDDRVVSFYPHNSSLVGLRDGLRVDATARDFTGDLYGVVVRDRETWTTGQGRSVQTRNHYLKSVKSFTRWLVRDRRTLADLAHVSRLNVATDRRHDRRALSPEEFRRLLDAARNGKRVQAMSGPDRAMMYALAAWTGFRKGEIGSLTLQSLDLDGDPPTATVAAAYSKRRRKDTQILHPELVKQLREWIATKPDLKPTDLLFRISNRVPGGADGKTHLMIKT